MEVPQMEISYSTNELTKLLLERHDIHEGNWILTVNFGFLAMNIRQSDTDTEVSPSGIVSVQRVGLQRLAEPLPFSVDAAVANPGDKKKLSRKQK